jgi:pimeloyl-ACP methyl ester carboxylesterase
VRRAATVLAFLAVAPASASAALKFGFTCGGNFECAHLKVPLDRSGTVPGSVRLEILRLRADNPQGAVFAIAGGPGQGASTVAEGFNHDLSAAIGRRDMIVIDQRGTGKSGALRCPTLDGKRQADGPIDARTAECAEHLGPARSHYTTMDSVADFEAVRAALGYDKITLFGVSYGTAVALAYAATYPDHVERLVLDSVVDPHENDPFGLTGLAALPRILGEVCRAQCAQITDDLAADVAALGDRLATGPLAGRLIDRRGRAKRKVVTARDVYNTIRAADLDNAARAEYPAAVHAAAAGDPAALVRMVHRFDDLVGKPPAPDPSAVQSLSFTLQAATLCEEAPFPWARTATPAERDAQLQAAADAVPDASFEPFDRTTMLVRDNNNLLYQCRRWPAAEQAPVVPDVAPDVPVLVLEGLEDTRTPLEVGLRVAARFPQASVVGVPKTGHSVAGRRGCARLALKRFFADRSVAGLCGPGLKAKPLVPVAPRSLAEVQGGAVAAVKLTLDDLAREVGLRLFPPVRGGGLRAGYFAGDDHRLRVRGWSYVPKLSLTGTVRTRSLAGRFVVRGPTAASSGELALTRKGTLHGTLGGERILTRWHRPAPLFFRR